MGMTTYFAATRDGEKTIGTAPEISALVGKPEKYIHKLASNGYKTKDGWRVERVKTVTPVYLAENPDDDPITGSAEDIGCLIGKTREYICRLARLGTVSKDGWRVKRLDEPNDH